MFLEKAFILDNESFEELRNHVNWLGKDIDSVYNLFEKIRNSYESEKRLTLSVKELEKLVEFYEGVESDHSKLIEDIWTDDEKEDNKRYCPIFEGGDGKGKYIPKGHELKFINESLNSQTKTKT